MHPTLRLGALFVLLSLSAACSGPTSPTTTTHPLIPLTPLTSSLPPPPTLSANPLSMDFGSQPISTASAASRVTQTNTGNAAERVVVRVNGFMWRDFAQTNNCPTVLAAGANCTLNVTFTPSVGGAEIGLLVIDGNQEEEDIVTITGTGTAN